MEVKRFPIEPLMEFELGFREANLRSEKTAEEFLKRYLQFSEEFALDCLTNNHHSVPDSLENIKCHVKALKKMAEMPPYLLERADRILSYDKNDLKNDEKIIEFHPKKDE